MRIEIEEKDGRRRPREERIEIDERIERKEEVDIGEKVKEEVGVDIEEKRKAEIEIDIEVKMKAEIEIDIDKRIGIPKKRTKGERGEIGMRDTGRETLKRTGNANTKKKNGKRKGKEIEKKESFKMKPENKIEGNNWREKKGTVNEEPKSNKRGK